MSNILHLFIISLTATTNAFPTRHRTPSSLPMSPPSVENETNDDSPTTAAGATKNKRIILIRHGRTYMNEYLSRPGSEWGDPNFTDIFCDEDNERYYRDSILTDKGEAQALDLSRLLGDATISSSSSLRKDDDDDGGNRSLIDELDLVVVSPLRRCIQTVQIGLLPHLTSSSSSLSGDNEPLVTNNSRVVPIVALPLASERLYLVSDVGSPVSELSKRYPWVDFKSHMSSSSSDGSSNGDERWWYSTEVPRPEWRPSGNGQRYACAGEPDDDFRRRMRRLCEWLDGREERTIALVCHWGVIEWLTGEDFDNCEMRVVKFEDILRNVKEKTTV